MATTDFDIIGFMGSLTGYDFKRETLEAIARRRGALEITSIADIPQRMRDLLTADMLFVIYTSPTQSGAQTISHGDFTHTRGSMYISDKRNIYALMRSLYRKWGEDPFDEGDGECCWINE